MNSEIKMHNMTAINTIEECDESTFTQSSIPHMDSLDVLNHELDIEVPLFPFDITESIEPNHPEYKRMVDRSEKTDYHQSSRVNYEIVREDVPSPDLTVVKEQISESKYLMKDLYKRNNPNIGTDSSSDSNIMETNGNLHQKVVYRNLSALEQQPSFQSQYQSPTFNPMLPRDIKWNIPYHICTGHGSGGFHPNDINEAVSFPFNNLMECSRCPQLGGYINRKQQEHITSVSPDFAMLKDEVYEPPYTLTAQPYDDEDGRISPQIAVSTKESFKTKCISSDIDQNKNYYSNSVEAFPENEYHDHYESMLFPLDLTNPFVSSTQRASLECANPIFSRLPSGANEPLCGINPKIARKVIKSDIAVQRLQLHETKFPTPISLDLSLDDLYSDEEFHGNEYDDVNEEIQTFHYSPTHEVRPQYDWGMANAQLEREQSQRQQKQTLALAER